MVSKSFYLLSTFSEFFNVASLILIAFLVLFIGFAIFIYLRYNRLKRINFTFKKKLRSLIRERDIGSEYYQLIAENITDVVWVYDLEKSEFNYISPSIEKFRGISVEEALNQGLADKFTPESYQRLLELLSEIKDKPIAEIDKRLVFEGEQQRADGTVFQSESYAFPIVDETGKIVALRGVTRDVSKQKQTEFELRSTERRLIDALENSKQILYRINYNDGTFDYISPYFMELTGVKLGENEKMRIEDFIELVHPEDRFMLEGRDYVESDFSNESKLSFMREFRIRVNENEYHWFSDWSTLIFDPQQRALANVGSLYDIDERVMVEIALRESESRFRTLAENSKDVIIRFSPNFRHMYVNRAISKIFPFGSDYFIGKSHRELGFPEEFCKHWEENIQTVFDEGKTVKGEIIFEGESGVLNLEYLIYAEYDDAKNVRTALANIRDITEHKKIEEQLRQKGMEYRLLFEYAHDAIFIEDSEENILNANKSAIKLFGYSFDELLQMKTSDIVSPEMQKKSAHSLYTDPHTSEDRTFETYITCKDGHDIPVDVALATFKVSGKRVIMSIVRDISKRKHAEHALKMSEKKHRTLFETIKDGIIQADLNGRIINVNNAFKEMLDYNLEDVKGKHYFEFIPEKWHKFIQTVVMSQIMERGFSDDSEKEFIRKDGRIIPAMCRAWLVKDNGDEDPQMWALIKNISETKKAEEELRQAKEEAERASKVKGDFLANMSHEIRTPMNGVIGMCNLLLRTSLNEEQQDYADSIRISAENLLKIINDILDISKIEAGKLELDEKEINLKKWLKRTNNIIAIKADEKGLRYNAVIEEGVPLVVYGDDLRLSQVVINLVSNAVKFTEKGEVKLTISNAEETDKEILLKFVVKDSGIGIASDMIGQVFKSFSQVDSSSKRRYTGTGLGLAISKNITTLMGGDIGVESELGKGSEFWFTARLRKRRHIETKEEISEFMQRLKILVVDDNSPDGFIIRDQLSLLKCKYDEVMEIEQAFGKLENAYNDGEIFKAVLIDSAFGDADLIDFVSRIRSSNNLKNTVLILMKALGSRIKKHSERNSFDAILPKPIKFDDLNELLVSKFVRKAPEMMETSTVGMQDQTRLTSFKEELNSQFIQKDKSGVKILLAEDNVINQKLALRILSKLGYTAHAVENGKRAIEELAQNEYTLVFMDIQMPIMDGVEATKKIRSGEANALNPDIPIIAMTAHAMKGDKERFLSEGLTDYISKPIEIMRLTQLLEKYTQ